LCAVEDACLDDLMQCRRIADRRQPEETDLALFAQPRERRRHLVKHLPHAKG
jgi:hypothetical protein